LNDLRKQEGLREILGLLADHGFDTQDALVQACMKLREELPILKRVARLEPRILRLADSIGITK
jgi:hypothetical protein